MEFIVTYLLLIAIGYFLSALAVALYARSRGRGALLFFGLSICLSPLLALIIAIICPKDHERLRQRALAAGELKACPHCAEAINREARVCPRCQRDIVADRRELPSDPLMRHQTSGTGPQRTDDAEVWRGFQRHRERNTVAKDYTASAITGVLICLSALLIWNRDEWLPRASSVWKTSSLSTQPRVSTHAISGVSDSHGCRAEALARVSAIESNDSVLEKGEVQDDVTQYEVRASDGTAAYCSHGGYCYGRYGYQNGHRIEVLQLRNCHLGRRSESDGWIYYEVVLTPSKNSRATMRLDSVERRLSSLGLCSACASNAASDYVWHPQSECGQLVSKALSGSADALRQLEESQEECQAQATP